MAVVPVFALRGVFVECPVFLFANFKPLRASWTRADHRNPEAEWWMMTDCLHEALRLSLGS